MRLHKHPARALALSALLGFGIITILGTGETDPPAPDWQQCITWHGLVEAESQFVNFIKHWYFTLPDGVVYASAYVETQDASGSPEVTVENVDVTPGNITGDVRVTTRVILDPNEAVDHRACVTGNEA